MAKKLGVNVIHAGVAYGPDYPENKLTPEAREVLKDRDDVWESDQDEEEPVAVVEAGTAPGTENPDDGVPHVESDAVTPAAAKLGQKVARN
jgi:hypothetical protein